MVYLIDELERSGLVERVRNPDDHRSFLIHLTGEGQRTQRKSCHSSCRRRRHPAAAAGSGGACLLRTLLTRIVDHWQALSAAQP
jgi:DNA-binding MarR family transcriptional regulator